MSYQAAIVGLKARLSDISGVKKVLAGQPTTVQATPLIYFELVSGNRVQRGQVTVCRYRVEVTVCVTFAENTIAEDQLAPFVNSVPAAIDSSSGAQQGGTLDGTVNIAMTPDFRAGYLAVGDVTFRTLTHTVEMVEKAAFGGGI